MRGRVFVASGRRSGWANGSGAVGGPASEEAKRWTGTPASSTNGGAASADSSSAPQRGQRSSSSRAADPHRGQRASRLSVIVLFLPRADFVTDGQYSGSRPRPAKARPIVYQLRSAR